MGWENRGTATARRRASLITSRKSPCLESASRRRKGTGECHQAVKAAEQTMVTGHSVAGGASSGARVSAIARGRPLEATL